MNPILKSTLRQLGLNTSVTTTVWYSIYLFLFKNDTWRRSRQMRDFYRSLVESVPLEEWGISSPMIFDIGANRGDKTELFRHAAERVVCVEPDHTCNRVLHERFQMQPGIRILEAAVDESNGYGIYYSNSTDSAFNTLSAKWKETLENTSLEETPIRFDESYIVETLTLDQLIASHGVPCYIKIDVEGFEYQVLKGLNQAVPFISIEANLPQFREETIWSIHRMQTLSPDVQYLYSTSEGFRDGTSEWMDGGRLISEIETTRSPFVEILARMHHSEPLADRIRVPERRQPEGISA